MDCRQLTQHCFDNDASLFFLTAFSWLSVLRLTFLFPLHCCPTVTKLLHRIPFRARGDLRQKKAKAKIGQLLLIFLIVFDRFSFWHIGFLMTWVLEFIFDRVSHMYSGALNRYIEEEKWPKLNISLNIFGCVSKKNSILDCVNSYAIWMYDPQY